MKKSIVILLLVIQILLLILFQNLYYLFKGFEETDISQLTNESKLMRNLKSMKTIFNGLSILLGLLIIASVIYLVVVYRRTKHEDKIKDLPPLHNYLLELRDSERELKDIVEKQQVDVIEKEELNKSIINNINSAIIFLNNKERIDIFNSVAEALFDQSYANAKNNSINKIMIKFQEVIGFIEKNKDKKISSEIESNEKIFFVDLNPIDKIGRLIIIKDITEEKKRELINRRNKNFIMLGEMTTFLTHEIRHSLGVIYGYTKTLKS